MKGKIILVLIIIGVLTARFSEGQIGAGNFPMNVTIPITFVQVSLSDKLAEGVTFTSAEGSVNNVQSSLLAGSFGNNATFNYGKADLKSGYWISVAGAVVDICNGAKYNLCSNLTCSGFTNIEIGIGNVSWSSSTSSDFYNPSQSNSIPMMLGYDATNNISRVHPGNKLYLRYWQSVPANFPPYNYSTIYQIQVVPTGGSCE
jgi:hypothetical protein